MSTLGHRAYLELRRRLADGEFPRAANCQSHHFRASRDEHDPCREAIARLASEGSSSTSRRWQLRPQHQSARTGATLRSSPSRGTVCRECGRNANYPQRLQEMRAICKDWRVVVDDLKNSGAAHATSEQMIRWNANERRFHELIIQASRNFWLIKIIEDLQLMAFSFNPQRGMAKS